MTKKEVQEFINTMAKSGDKWTEEEILNSFYMDMSLEKATTLRLNDLYDRKKILEYAESL